MIKRFFIFLLLCSALQLNTDAFWSQQFSRNAARLNKYACKLPELMPLKKHPFDFKPEEISRTRQFCQEIQDRSNPAEQSRWKNPYAVFGFGLLSTFGYYQTSWQLEKMRKEGKEAHALRQEEFKKRSAEQKPLLNWSDFPDEKPGSESEKN